MNVIIIEDEKLAAERLEELLNEIDPTITIQKRLASVEASVQWLRHNTPDLIFLDIQLADGISFSIFDAVDVRSPIIFVTADDHYAIKAFKVNSIDYLLKPVKKEELADSLKKLCSISGASRQDVEELIRYIKNKESGYKKRFLIRFGDTIRTVPTEEIAFFYSLEKSVFLSTKEKKHFPVDLTLDALEGMLNPERFFRINRKMIVAFESIRNMVPYSRSRIRIDLQPESPKEVEALVSVERSASFKQWMDK